jgi:hypothetical protein
LEAIASEEFLPAEFDDWNFLNDWNGWNEPN